MSLLIQWPHFYDSLCDQLKDLLFILTTLYTVRTPHRSDVTDSRHEFRQAWKNAFCTAVWSVLLLSDRGIVISLRKQPFFFVKLKLKNLEIQFLNFQLPDRVINRSGSRRLRINKIHEQELGNFNKPDIIIENLKVIE